MLRHPHDCHLTLICLVQADEDLRESDFMSGIRYLANQTDNKHAKSLAFALGAGSTGGDCSQLSSSCTLSTDELMEAIEEMEINPASNHAKRMRRDLTHQRVQQSVGQLQRQHGQQGTRRNGFSLNNKRRQSFMSNMPPFVRPVQARLVKWIQSTVTFYAKYIDRCLSINNVFTFFTSLFQ